MSDFLNDFLINAHTHIDIGISGRKVVCARNASENSKIIALDDGIYKAVGIYPSECACDDNDAFDAKFAALDNLLCRYRHRIHAVGEIGLDRRFPDLSLQIARFEKLLRLAKDHRLPVVVHCVRALPEMLKSLKKFPNLPVMLHGFRQNAQIAENCGKYVRLFGIGEALLYDNGKLREAISALPTEKLAVESDDKDVDLDKIAAIIAEIKNIPNITEILNRNCSAFFDK